MIRLKSSPTCWGISSLLLVVSFNVHTAPTISSISQENENELTIQGNGFGLGPSVVLYDSLENIRQEDGTITLSPGKGDWHETKGQFSELVSGPFGEENRAVVVRDSSKGTEGKLFFAHPDTDGRYGVREFQQVYYSFAVRDLGDFPAGGANSFSDMSATKDSWMMYGNRGDRVTPDNIAGHDIAMPTWVGHNFWISGNNTDPDPTYRQSELRDNWDFGGWNTYMFHAKLDENDPYGNAEGFFAFLNKNRYHKNIRSGNLMNDQTDNDVPPYWDRIKFNPWARVNDSQIKRAMTNFYVAIGDNANARVVLTNAEKLENSTRIQHLLPVQWNEGTITALMPESLKDKPLYLHVINKEEEKSLGYPVSSNPNPPANVSVE